MNALRATTLSGCRKGLFRVVRPAATIVLNRCLREAARRPRPTLRTCRIPQGRYAAEARRPPPTVENPKESPVSAIPRDQWYVAAYGREIGPTLFTRTVCGESILFWRTREGQVTAMANRCVHRRFPLSQPPTRLVEDQVVCGYHGFTYGTDGRCTAVPGQTRVPRTARLVTYPVVERDSFVWVWIGDPARADSTRIPRVPWLDSPSYTAVSGIEPLRARFGLLVDNLMDLSHETYLHGGYIGTPEVAATPIATEVDEAAGVVRVSRHMDDAQCPPFYSRSTGLTGRIARWQDIEYTPPCLYQLHSRIAPVGVLPRPDGTDPDAFHVEVVYAITPETEHTTHDFWAVARDFALDDEEVSGFLAEQNRTVVLQDVAALDVLEAAVATEPAGSQELSINIDTGGLAARRMLANLAARGEAAAAGA
jgi:vanillate O-demethylase monooxygenase subunit